MLDIRNTSAGLIGVEVQAGLVCRLLLPSEASEAVREGANALTERCFRELAEYFAGERTGFDLPLRVAGTVFQRAVWRMISEIPFGGTCTYGEIAVALGRPGAARAVGAACHANELPILIPCHRVIGSGGRMTGYGGSIPLKVRLLTLEGAIAPELSLAEA